MTARGFTLIEVLIASTILFAALAVVSEAYRSSLLAGERATRTAEILTPLPLIVGHIQTQLLETPNERVEGRGEILGVQFEFKAISNKFSSPPSRIDPESGELVSYPPRFRLYDVRLTVIRGTMFRQFTYQEIAWLSSVA